MPAPRLLATLAALCAVVSACTGGGDGRRVTIEELRDFEQPLPADATGVDLAEFAPADPIAFCDAIGTAPSRWIGDALFPAQFWHDTFDAVDDAPAAIQPSIDRLVAFTEARQRWSLTGEGARPELDATIDADVIALAETALTTCPDLPPVVGPPGISDRPADGATSVRTRSPPGAGTSRIGSRRAGHGRPGARRRLRSRVTPRRAPSPSSVEAPDLRGEIGCRPAITEIGGPVQSSDAFLSFRHDASRWLALLLAKTLEDAGIDVFIDIRLRGGRFDTELLEQIEQRPYFIVVLEPGTLPRCREPEDWVLRELRHAVETDRTIIPVATAEFESGDIDEFLPADMARELRRFHGITVRYKTFQLQVTELASEYLVPIEVTLGIDEQISDAARDRAAVARDAAASAAADLAALGLEDLAFGRQARSVLVQLVGVPAFALTELTARVLNFGRRPKSLPPDVVDLLGPYLPSLDIGSVKTVSPARLPVAQRRFSIMSVGGRVYLEHAPQIDDVRAMTALLHELVHVEQYRRLGRLRFARMYAAGFAAGMSYRENPLEAEAFAIARLHRDELAAAVG